MVTATGERVLRVVNRNKIIQIIFICILLLVILTAVSQMVTVILSVIHRRI